MAQSINSGPEAVKRGNLVTPSEETLAPMLTGLCNYKAGQLRPWRNALRFPADQATRTLERVVLYPRFPGGRAIGQVTLGGKAIREFTRDTVILALPKRDAEIRVSIQAASW